MNQQERTAREQKSIEVVGAALFDAFGVHFDFWVWKNQWTPLSAGIASERLSGSEENALSLRGYFVHLPRNQAAEPQVTLSAEGHSVLIIPIMHSELGQVVATARFTEASHELLRRMANLFVREFSGRGRLQEYEAELESCQKQISHDFEQLVFLTTLTENSAINESAHDEWSLAKTGLPLLSHLIQAEAVALLPAHASDENRTMSVGKPVLWTGARPLDDATCCRLVETFRNAAAVQPLVKNRFPRQFEAAGFSGVRDLILVQVARAQSVLGWIVALNRVNRRELNSEHAQSDTARFPLSDFEFGTVEATMLSTAAERFATYARNVALLREKESLFVNMIRALVSSLDARDPYTRGHSERVAQIGCRIARQLALSETECERLYLTGLLHDIGKIGVADAILQKPGKLTPEEFDQIKQHPDLGCFILQGLTQLSYVLPGVRHHHEAYDGTGYPAGLAADKIPLEARILAVADSFDAMSSHRPYRLGMPTDRVEAILRSGAAKQWDSRVVDAFFRILPQIKDLNQTTAPGTLSAPSLTFPTTSWSPNTDRVDPLIADTN